MKYFILDFCACTNANKEFQTKTCVVIMVVFICLLNRYILLHGINTCERIPHVTKRNTKHLHVCMPRTIVSVLTLIHISQNGIVSPGT